MIKIHIKHHRYEDFDLDLSESATVSDLYDIICNKFNKEFTGCRLRFMNRFLELSNQQLKDHGISDGSWILLMTD